MQILHIFINETSKWIIWNTVFVIISVFIIYIFYCTFTILNIVLWRSVFLIHFLKKHFWLGVGEILWIFFGFLFGFFLGGVVFFVVVVCFFSPRRDCFSVRISSSECHFLCEHHRFLCSVKMAPFRVKLAAEKNNNKKKCFKKIIKKLTRTLPDSSISTAHHMVTISFSWDHWNQRCNFFSNFSAFPQRRH